METFWKGMILTLLFHWKGTSLKRYSGGHANVWPSFDNQERNHAACCEALREHWLWFDGLKSLHAVQAANSVQWRSSHAF
jgi:hypothetical protein